MRPPSLAESPYLTFDVESASVFFDDETARIECEPGKAEPAQFVEAIEAREMNGIGRSGAWVLVNIVSGTIWHLWHRVGARPFD